MERDILQRLPRLIGVRDVVDANDIPLALVRAPNRSD